MNRSHFFTAVLALIVGGAAAALFLKSHDAMPMSADTQAGACDDGSAALYWVAPMDSDFRQDGPGKSPMGMDLIPYCESRDSGGADVSISSTLEQNLGVRTAAVKYERLSHHLRAVGNIAWNESRVRAVHARADGWVEQLGVSSTGDQVAEGQMLYQLFSPKLFTAESEFLAAAGNRMLRASAEQRLRALGYEPAQIKALERSGQASERMQKRAVEAARVQALAVRRGQYVTPGSLLLTLADPKQVWLIAQLPEREASLVQHGQKARVSVTSLPGRYWDAVVTHIHPELDERTRTQRLRLELSNDDEALRPGMYAEAKIELLAPEPALLVPNDALIRRGADVRVIRRNTAGEFDVLPVLMGASAGDWTAVSGPIIQGDELVVSGQFLLDSEANIDAEILRLRAPSTEQASMTRGTVRALDRERRFITLEHEYIVAIDMPAMTMSFDIADDVDLQGITPGQMVHFLADAPANADYRVTHIEVMP
ncbi:MAG: efflux RND transporter periplasmic adaptor subunit [Oceanococcus sp.]